MQVTVEGHQLDELPRLCLVLRIFRDDIEGAAPGRPGFLGQLRDAPQAFGGGGDPGRHVAGQPGARHLRGDAATLESLCPVVGPGGDLAVKLVLTNRARQLKRAHKAWRVDQHIALRIEIQAVARFDARADQNVFDVARIRHQVSAGARLDLEARGHKALPRLGQFGLGHARLLQYVGAVQQGAWADVGRRRHHGAALGGALLVGKRNVAGLVLPNEVGRLGQV